MVNKCVRRIYFVPGIRTQMCTKSDLKSDYKLKYEEDKKITPSPIG